MIKKYYHITASLAWAALATIHYAFNFYGLTNKCCSISDAHANKILNY